MRDPLLRVFLSSALITTLFFQASHSPAAQPGKSAAQQESSPRVTLPAGTVISVRIADAVNSSHNHSGDLITGSVDPSVLVGKRVVIPRGTEAHLRLMQDKKGGRFRGKAAIRLELVALVMNQEKENLNTNDYDKKEGALSAKAKGEVRASTSGGIRAAASTNPAVGAADPIIAIFRPAKVELLAGTRIPFRLTDPFTFSPPRAPEHSPSSP